jgi:hypothetical protein
MGTSRITVLFASLALFPCIAEAQDDSARARAAFERGTELAEAGRCPEAIEQFWISYRLVPGQPSPIYAIGVCQMQIGGAENDRAALESFDQYLDLGTNEERIQEVQAHVATVLARLAMGTARVDVSPPNAAVRVDGQEVPAGRLARVRLPAGAHLVAVSAEGFEEAEREVTVAAGQVAEVSVELRPEPAAEPPPEVVPPPVDVPDDAEPTGTGRRGVHQRWWFWTIIGAVVVGGVATGLALGLRDDDEVPGGDWRVDLP